MGLVSKGSPILEQAIVWILFFYYFILNSCEAIFLWDECSFLYDYVIGDYLSKSSFFLTFFEDFKRLVGVLLFLLD